VKFEHGKLSKVGKSLKVAYCGFDIAFINNLAIQRGMPAPAIPEIPGQAGEFIVIDAESNGDSEALKEDLDSLGGKRSYCL
jgi:hypothetical protein